MQHQPKIAVEPDGDTFANAAQLAHHVPLRLRERRVCGAQQEYAEYAHAHERLPDNARFESAEVGADVGQLRHGHQDDALRAPIFAIPGSSAKMRIWRSL